MGKADKIVHIIKAEQLEKNHPDLDEKIKLYLKQSESNKFLKEAKIVTADNKKQLILGYELEDAFIGYVKTYRGYWSIFGKELGSTIGYKKLVEGHSATQFLTKPTTTKKSPLKDFEVGEISEEFSETGEIIKPTYKTDLSDLQPVNEFIDYNIHGQTSIKKLKTEGTFFTVFNKEGLPFETQQFLTEKEKLINDLTKDFGYHESVKQLASKILSLSQAYGRIVEIEYDYPTDSYIFTYAKSDSDIYGHSDSTVDILGVEKYLDQ